MASHAVVAHPATCSYVEAVLNPIADAISSALKSDTQVWVTMQGEMGVRDGCELALAGTMVWHEAPPGPDLLPAAPSRCWTSLTAPCAYMQATVFFHPREWQEVANQLRSRITGGQSNRRVWGGKDNAVQQQMPPGVTDCCCKLLQQRLYRGWAEQRQAVRMHPGAHHRPAGIPGQVSGSLRGSRVRHGPETDMSQLHSLCWLEAADNGMRLLLAGRAVAEFDLPAIQALFNSAVDYIGLSAYIPQASVRFEVSQVFGSAAALVCRNSQPKRSGMPCLADGAGLCARGTHDSLGPGVSVLRSHP